MTRWRTKMFHRKLDAQDRVSGLRVSMGWPVQYEADTRGRETAEDNARIAADTLDIPVAVLLLRSDASDSPGQYIITPHRHARGLASKHPRFFHCESTAWPEVAS